jgi:ribosomal protein L24E
MRIRCDVCGSEIAKETAIVEMVDAEVLYFCSTRCREDLQYHETVRDPDQEEDQTSSVG